MAFKIVKNGDETEIQAAVAWVESLGIPRNIIRGITVDAQVGQPLTVTATFMVPEVEHDPAPAAQPCPSGKHIISGLNSRGTCDQCEMEQPRIPWTPHTDPQGRKCVIPDCDGLHPQGWWEDSARPVVHGDEETNEAAKLEHEYDQG